MTRNAPAAASAATSSQARRPRGPDRRGGSSNRAASAAQTARVTKKASVRSGSACRAVATMPALVAAIRPASSAVGPSYQRRAQKNVTSTRPAPASAEGNLAAPGEGPAATYAAAASQ